MRRVNWLETYTECDLKLEVFIGTDEAEALRECPVVQVDRNSAAASAAASFQIHR